MSARSEVANSCWRWKSPLSFLLWKMRGPFQHVVNKDSAFSSPTCQNKQGSFHSFIWAWFGNASNSPLFYLLVSYTWPSHSSRLYPCTCSIWMRCRSTSTVVVHLYSPSIRWQNRCCSRYRGVSTQLTYWTGNRSVFQIGGGGSNDRCTFIISLRYRADFNVRTALESVIFTWLHRWSNKTTCSFTLTTYNDCLMV